MKLEAKSLSFSYGKKKVIEDLSLSLNSGEIVGLLGKNGVGKSTLIELLLGLKKAKGGNIYLDSKPLSEFKSVERAKALAYVPQNLEEMRLSVYDFLTLGRLPYFYLSPSLEDKEEITKIIFEFGLEKIAYSSMSEISGGERQLASLARAMLSNPSILFLDEPTSSLDVKNKEKVFKALKDIASKHNVAILVSLHDVQEAISACSRLAFLENGRIAYDIVPDELNEEILLSVYGTNATLHKHLGHTYIDFYNKGE